MPGRHLTLLNCSIKLLFWDPRPRLWAISSRPEPDFDDLNWDWKSATTIHTGVYLAKNSLLRYAEKNWSQANVVFWILVPSMMLVYWCVPNRQKKNKIKKIPFTRCSSCGLPLINAIFMNISLDGCIVSNHFFMLF